MKRKIAFCLLALSGMCYTYAQNINVNLRIANASVNSFTYCVHNRPLTFNDISKQFQSVDDTGTRTANIKFNFSAPKIVTLTIGGWYGADTSRFIIYDLFLSPGDNILLQADFKKPGKGIKITGKGSNNNQPMLLAMHRSDYSKYYGDTIPNRIMAVISKQHQINKSLTHRYINQYHPSPAFIKYLNYNLMYDEAGAYFFFKENNKVRIEKQYERNFDKWQFTLDSIITAAQKDMPYAFKTGTKNTDMLSLKTPSNNIYSYLNNDDALISDEYASFLQDFLMREKERLWRESRESPETFYKQWYNTDVQNGRPLFYDDQENLLKEKIINKYFTGRTAQFLYTDLLHKADEGKNPKNVVEIYNRFKAKYPKSEYVKTYAPIIAAIKQREQNTPNSKILFAADNGATMNKLDQVLALFKGKTVLVDMWGTWCSPCRQEIDANSAALKKYFAGKNLDYLYVANYDQSHEENWKKLINYFNLEGTHILANPMLTNDIMGKVNGRGYPTYFIIKKDGSYEISNAGFPLDRNKLIKQLEASLAL